jgi:hypothetical protein
MARPNLYRLVALLATSAVVAMYAAVPAETTNVQIFGTTISLPDPPGLVPLINKDSHYYKFGERLQAANHNVLLADFLPAKEAAIADIDQLPSPTYWAIAYGLGSMMSRSVTAAQFKDQILPEMEKAVATAARDPELLKRLGEGTDSSVAQLGKDMKIEPGRLRMGEIEPLGIFTKRDNYAIYGAATRIRIERADTVLEAPVVTVIGFLSVKERLFCIALYSLYRDEKDLDKAKQDSAAWAEAITRANVTPQ